MIALGEFAEGFRSSAHPVLAEVRSCFSLLLVDEETALQYSEIARALRRSGQLIGSNDLWIAASARRHNLPLVTNNREQFGRVSGLSLVGY